MDVPIDFRVAYLGRARHNALVLSSKASGEPPLVLATSAFMALREAIASARADAGLGQGFFPLDSPATVSHILDACCGASDDRKAVQEKRLIGLSDGTDEKSGGGGMLQNVAKQFK